MVNAGSEIVKLVYFDYCACIVLLMIFVSTVLRKMTKGRLNRYFLELVITALIASAVDISAVTHDNALLDNTSLRSFEHCVYLLFHSMTTPVFAVYVTELTGTKHLIRRNKLMMIVSSLPYIVLIGAFLLNPVLKKMFYIDGGGRYVRGEWFILMYISTAFYVAFAMYLIIKYRKSIAFGRWLSLIVLIVFMLAAVAVQYFKPQYPVEMFSNAVGLLFISVMVQRPEEIIDVESEAKSRNAFNADVQRAFDNGRRFCMISVKLLNAHSFGDILSYDESLTLLKETRSRIAKETVRYEMFTEIYYLRNGVFVLLLDNKYLEDIGDLAKEIYSATSEPITVKDMQINLVSAVCIINCPEDIASLADFSAFISHSVGHETAGVSRAYDILNSDNYDMIVDMDGIIGRALTDGGLEVYYQPIYSTEENRFNSAEALLRLKDPKYGFVPPDMFIPVAEQNGAIHKIGMFVLESVCRFIASEEFEKLGIDYIEVNLSVVQCMNATLADDIMGVMKKYGVGFDKINLEITESFAAYYQNTMAANISQLLEAGITFSLDDFGTGYSNMQSIASLPLVITKLDKTFVDMNTEKETVVVERSIDMIKALKMKIVVEGVETKEMLKRFSDLGCEYIQGYYFSKPLPREQFESFVLDFNNGEY